MKKNIYLAAILLMLLSLLQTQRVTGQAALVALLFGDKVASEKFNISLEAGGTFTKYTNVPNTKRSRMGINFGIAGNLQLSENWYFSPNIYFLAARNMQFKSYSLNTGTPGLDNEFTDVPTVAELRYIDIPIFLSYQTNNGKFRYSLGPQISLLRDAKAQYEGDEGEFTQNFDSFLHTVDYGVIADFCYVLGKANKGKGVHVHARYYYGFADIFNDKISTDVNRLGFFSLHLSLPFITEELAAKNLENGSSQ
jgi:hypothetical protein